MPHPMPTQCTCEETKSYCDYCAMLDACHEQTIGHNEEEEND